MCDSGPVHQRRLLGIIEDEEPGAVTVEMIEESRASGRPFGKNPAGAGETAEDIHFDAEPDTRVINVIVWLRRRQWGFGNRDGRFCDENALVVAGRQHEIRVGVVEEFRRILRRKAEARHGVEEDLAGEGPAIVEDERRRTAILLDLVVWHNGKIAPNGWVG